MPAELLAKIKAKFVTELDSVRRKLAEMEDSGTEHSRAKQDLEEIERLLRGGVPRNGLEQRVEERIAQLKGLNEQLQAEIQERKKVEENLLKREEELSLVYDNAPVLMLLVYEDCRVRRANKVAMEACGGKDIVGMRLGEALCCLHVLDGPDGCGSGPHCETCGMRNMMEDTLRTGKFHNSEEHSVSLEGGGKSVRVDLLASSVPLLMEGSPYALVVLENITERKRMASEQLTAKECAEAASRAKSAFLANMSHDIRTPMSGVLGMLQLLQGTSLDAVQMDWVQQAVNSGKSLIAILNDILDVSRIEAQKLEIRRDVFDFPRILREASDLFLISASDKNIDLFHCIDDGFPSALKGDGGRIRQILFNLVSNAVKYTRQGKVVVSATAQKAPAREGFVRVSCVVSDTGVGIAPEQLEKVLEPFSQLKSPGPDEYHGAGLGLAIVKGLLELMDAKLEIESEPGKGTSIAFTLDLEWSETGTEDRSSRPLSSYSPLRILLVEDDVTCQQVTKIFLQRHGHAVTCADNGKLALAALEKESFDLIFMDVMMPEMDGLEATRRIRMEERFKGLPIIALTACVMAEDREVYLKAGMNDTLAKPVSVEDLLEAVAKAVEK